MFSNKFSNKSRMLSGLVGLASIGLVSTAAADVIFTASGTVASNSVAATADFSISGNTLTITLTNTSPGNLLESPGNTLTGIAFLLANGDSIALTPSSAISPNAILQSAACTANPCTGTNVNVGGEFGFQTGFSFDGFSNQYAIGSSGYITTGIPGDLGNFNGLNLQNPVSLNGIEFGILSNAHGALNGGLLSQALLVNDVVLTLTGVSGLTENQITSVFFLYGTSPEGSTHGSCIGSNNCGDQFVPEPGSLALIGVALSGLALVRRRWNKA